MSLFIFIINMINIYNNMNQISTFNSKIKTFIFINLVFIILDILLNIYYPNFKLYWPAYNILPGILNAKINILEFDFFKFYNLAKSEVKKNIPKTVSGHSRLLYF